jgi:hypothetical protein
MVSRKEHSQQSSAQQDGGCSRHDVIKAITFEYLEPRVISTKQRHSIKNHLNCHGAAQRLHQIEIGDVRGVQAEIVGLKPCRKSWESGKRKKCAISFPFLYKAFCKTHASPAGFFFSRPEIRLASGKVAGPLGVEPISGPASRLA